MFWQLIIRVLSFMVAFSSWTFWVQVRGVGSDHNCLSNNGDASVGEGISHVVASIQSGNSARNGVLYPQKGNITILQYLFPCFCFKTFNFACLFFALIHLSLRCMFQYFFHAFIVRFNLELCIFRTVMNVGFIILTAHGDDKTCSCPVKHKPDTLSGTRNQRPYAIVNWLELRHYWL